jgi:hypothetical protein
MPTPAPTRTGTGWAAPRGPFLQPPAPPRPDGLAAVFRRGARAPGARPEAQDAAIRCDRDAHRFPRSGCYTYTTSYYRDI